MQHNISIHCVRQQFNTLMIYKCTHISWYIRRIKTSHSTTTMNIHLFWCTTIWNYIWISCTYWIWIWTIVFLHELYTHCCLQCLTYFWWSCFIFITIIKCTRIVSTYTKCSIPITILSYCCNCYTCCLIYK